MVHDIELFLDQLGNPGARPEFGGEAKFARQPLEPREDLALLGAIELGCGSGVGHSLQSLFTPLTSGGPPAPDTAITDTEDAGYLGDGRSFPDSLDGALATPLEFLGASVRSHGRKQTPIRSL